MTVEASAELGLDGGGVGLEGISKRLQGMIGGGPVIRVGVLGNNSMISAGVGTDDDMVVYGKDCSTDELREEQRWC